MGCNFCSKNKIIYKNELSINNQNVTTNPLRKIKVPIFQDELNEEFLDLFENMNITVGIIPNKKDADIWNDIIEKDPLKEVYEIKDNTWGFEYKFKEEDLFKKINDYQSIK